MKRKRPLKTVGIILLVCLLIVIVYVAYVFIDYYRIDDNQTLDVGNQQSAVMERNKAYTVMTYNVGFGAYSADYSFFMDGGKYSRALSEQAVYDNIGGAVKTLLQYNPDFMMIEEVGYDSDNSYHVDERQLFYDGFAAYSYTYALNNHSSYLFYPFNCPFGKNNAGILFLSSTGIADSVIRQLPIESGFTKLVDLDRCYSVNHVKTDDGQDVYFYATHLSAYSSDGSIADQQVRVLMADMQEKYDAGAYVICGGDFNKDLLGDSSAYFGVSNEGYTWAQPFPASEVSSDFSIIASSNVPSCRNADRPYDETDFVITIDGFIVSNNVTVNESYVVDTGFAYSDHNPVYMSFTLQ